nr:MAG TPA: hypothetical protein [Caudoviricetes sp.]
MIKYVCNDTEKFLDELLVAQLAIEKELREVMTKFRNLPECGDTEFGDYAFDIWWIANEYQNVLNLERVIDKTHGGAVLAFGTFYKLKKYNPNIERIFECVYSEC